MTTPPKHATLQRALVLAGLAACLLTAGALTIQKEALARDGAHLLLELAPVDPRSLIQGDYMDLDYRLARDAWGEGSAEWPRQGHLVIRLDGDHVGRFVRRHIADTPLAEDERLLLYRQKRWGSLDIGARSFFFQEGDAELYEGARYGELRITEDGQTLLIGLLDQHRQPIGRPGAAPLR